MSSIPGHNLWMVAISRHSARSRETVLLLFSAGQRVRDCLDMDTVNLEISPMSHPSGNIFG